jgi:thiamine-phosphate pyrophosphorylase
VAFGRFFSSNTKPLAVQADAQLLRQARPLLQIPIVAIGGITPENGAPLLAAGADMLAVIHGLFGQPDIRAACDSFNTLFEQEGNRT